MAIGDEVSDRYGNNFLPVLPRGHGVCPVCHSWRPGTYPTCPTCYRGRKTLTVGVDALDFVALSVRYSPLGRDLAFYKDERTSPAERERIKGDLTEVLRRWLAGHERCLSKAAGVPAFSVVATIPSTKHRVIHPLEEMVGKSIDLTRGRWRDVLTATAVDPEDRTHLAKRFTVANLEPGLPVLLIDDTMTTGSRIQGAAAALKAAGSGPVGAVVIGRHFDTHQPGDFGEVAQQYFERSRALGWSWDCCCLCDKRATS